MRKKYYTLEEYRAANALRQKNWRRKRKLKLGLKAVDKRGRKPKHLASLTAKKAVTKTLPKSKSRNTKRGLELAIN